MIKKHIKLFVVVFIMSSVNFLHASFSNGSFSSKEGFFPSIPGSHSDSGVVPESIKNNKNSCFCAWFFCCTQSSCCPTRDDCRSYKVCSLCVSAESRIHSNCGEKGSIICCPCVMQKTTMQ